MPLKASDYLITPVDLYHGIIALFRLSPMGWVKLILVLGTFFLARHYGVGVIDAGFLTFLIATFAYNIEARVSFMFAIFFLVLIMLILVVGPHTEYINNTTWPEPIAVWVYYFLAIGVLKEVWDHVRKTDKDEDQEISPSFTPKQSVHEKVVTRAVTPVVLPLVSRRVVLKAPPREDHEGVEKLRTRFGVYGVKKEGNRVMVKKLHE